MKITKDILAGKIVEFLNKQLTVEELVNWAETAMLDGNYQDEYFDEISESLSQIGVINVKGFELPVAFYLNSLKKLDYEPIFGLKPNIQKIETEEFAYV